MGAEEYERDETMMKWKTGATATIVDQVEEVFMRQVKYDSVDASMLPKSGNQ